MSANPFGTLSASDHISVSFSALKSLMQRPNAVRIETVTTTASIDEWTAGGSTEFTDLVLCDATGGAFTVTLPSAVKSAGRRIIFKKIDVSANAITLDGDASETIDGATTNASLASQYDTITLACDGTEWWIL